MSFQVISSSSFLDPSEQVKFYAFFCSSLVTICLGFIAAGRDGLMFDTRVVRGLHRLSRYGLALYFFLYSIFLSIPQWIMNSDGDLCVESFHFFNETSRLIIATECSQLLDAINVLFLIIIMIDPVYIFFFLYQADFRAAESATDKLRVRIHQKRGFIVSFVILFIKMGLLIPRFIMILITGNVGGIILSAMNMTLFGLNLFVHVRCLQLQCHVIGTYSKLSITDTTIPSSSKRRNTSSDDDHHNVRGSDDDHDGSSDDDHDDKNRVNQSLLPTSIVGSRPVQKVKSSPRI